MDFLFDELQIPVCDKDDVGLLLYGVATLKDNRDGDFYVSLIRLDGGAVLRRPSSVNSASGFEGELFKRIAKVIEDDKTTYGRHAALEWASQRVSRPRLQLVS
jgi:hypothetical protein